jgi:hypothetical protein
MGRQQRKGETDEEAEERKIRGDRRGRGRQKRKGETEEEGRDRRGRGRQWRKGETEQKMKRQKRKV